ELARATRLLERAMHALGLAVRDEGVARSVREQHGRGCVRRMMQRRRETNPLRVVAARPEERADHVELGGKRSAPAEIVRTIMRDDAADALRDVAQGRRQGWRERGKRGGEMR